MNLPTITITTIYRPESEEWLRRYLLVLESNYGKDFADQLRNTGAAEMESTDDDGSRARSEYRLQYP